MKTLAALALAATTFVATPANAALIVSGDSNIFGGGGTEITDMAANQQFLLNIVGGNVLLQGTTSVTFDTRMDEVSSFLTAQSVTNTLLGNAATVTAVDLAGRSLFIGYLPGNAYSVAEIAALADFLDAGGSILFTGDNALSSDFIAANGFVNDALTAFGSTMSIDSATIDSGFNTATIAVANAITAGTSGFRYAATSEVVGGEALYLAQDNTPFMAFEGLQAPAVPEPATWALMLLGMGAIGMSMRNRRTKQSVSYA